MSKKLLVHVYYNLNKKMFSIKMGTKVIAHSDSLVLKNAIFKVSQRGWERVQKTGVRNVHAGVTGELIFNPEEFPEKLPKEKIRYNPFKSSNFLKENGEPIIKADVVLFKNGRCYANFLQPILHKDQL